MCCWLASMFPLVHLLYTHVCVFGGSSYMYVCLSLLGRPFEKYGVVEFGVIKSIALNPSGSHVLAHTSEGVVAAYDIERASWKTLFHSRHYASYSIMKVCQQTGSVAIGSVDGKFHAALWETTLTWNFSVSSATRAACCYCCCCRFSLL